MQLMRITTALAAALTVLALAPAAGARNANGIDGVYRISWTEKQLAVAGTSQRYAHANCPSRCIVTMTLLASRLRVHGFPPPDCLGTYTVTGAAVSIHQKQHCHGTVVARWALNGRQLRLNVKTATDPGDRILYGGKPWRKIG
jgi:hypothetical protein